MNLRPAGLLLVLLAGAALLTACADTPPPVAAEPVVEAPKPLEPEAKMEVAAIPAPRPPASPLTGLSGGLLSERRVDHFPSGAPIDAIKREHALMHLLLRENPTNRAHCLRLGVAFTWALSYAAAGANEPASSDARSA